jgi:hypothetical protein
MISIRFISLFCLLWLLAATGQAQYISHEEDKLAIFEIVQPDDRVGAGFAVKDDILGQVLITCKHLIQDSCGNYYDKIFVRRNKLLKTKQAVSDTSGFYLFLKSVNNNNGEEKHFFYPHPDPNIDLVIIPFYYLGQSLNRYKPIFHFEEEMIKSLEELDSLGINGGLDVEAVGFSLTSALFSDKIHYHISRFGKIALYTTDVFPLMIDSVLKTANYMLLDISIRPGDSGSPILAYIGNKRHIIGMVIGLSPDSEYGIGYPSHYIDDLLKSVKEKNKRLN